MVEQKPERIRAETAGGRPVPAGCTASQILDEGNTPFQDRTLFFDFQTRGVLVAIAVVPNLVPLSDQALAFQRKRLDRVAGNKPGRFDVVFR